MQCYRHPRTETFVSCGRCDKPICPKCMVSGPAGMRCRDCGTISSPALYQIPPARLALAAVAALAVGTAGAFLMTFVGFFILFIAPAYGRLTAEAVLWASGRKQGRVIEATGVLGILGGAAVMILVQTHKFTQFPLPFLLVGYIWPLLGVLVAAVSCYWRLK
jgi:hypothetical protein